MVCLRYIQAAKSDVFLRTMKNILFRNRILINAFVWVKKWVYELSEYSLTGNVMSKFEKSQ